MDIKVITKYVCWALVVLITAVCVFFIVHNAQWQIGDDSLVIGGIGFGGYFSPTYTIWPESGRFFPTAYWGYNVLALIWPGAVPAIGVYWYQSLFFIMMTIFGMAFFIKIQDTHDTLWKYVIALLAVCVVIGRSFDLFNNCFSTGWFSRGLTFVYMLLLYLFISTKRWGYAIAYLLMAVYFTYGVESAFVAPLSLGVCGLIFMRDNNTRNEKIFYWLLIADAIIYLIIYYFFIYLKIEDVYDSSHGVQVGYIENALKMLFAQKIFWIAIPLFFVRLWKIIVSKERCTVFDLWLMCAAATCCGNFVLKLERPSYYSAATIMCIPSIVYFISKSFKPYWCASLLLLLAAFYMRKIPSSVKETNMLRTESKQFVEMIINQYQQGRTICFYNPSKNQENFDSDMCAWHFSTLHTYIQYVLQDKTFQIIEYEENPHMEEDVLWITMDMNNELTVDGNSPIEQMCSQVAYYAPRGMRAWINKE